MTKEELIEKLADKEHQRWSSWQKYLHSKCGRFLMISNNEKQYKNLLVPIDLFEQWKRQINTDYKDLSEEDKQKDRDQVMKYFNLIEEYIKKGTPLP